MISYPYIWLLFFVQKFLSQPEMSQLLHSSKLVLFLWTEFVWTVYLLVILRTRLNGLKELLHRTTRISMLCPAAPAVLHIRPHWLTYFSLNGWTEPFALDVCSLHVFPCVLVVSLKPPGNLGLTVHSISYRAKVHDNTFSASLSLSLLSLSLSFLPWQMRD